MEIVKPKAIAAKGCPGLLLRAYALKMSDVPKRVEFMRLSVDAALSVNIFGERAVKVVHIIVPTDSERFPGEADCGHLVSALRTEFEGQKNVIIEPLKKGDIFCSALNYGVSLQRAYGCKYSIIASGEANSYLNGSTVTEMFTAAGKGALATFVAIGELQESILQGKGANTFAMWEIEALQTAGGFSHRDAKKPKDSRFANYARGWSSALSKDVYYQLSGVEEIRVLCYLVEHYGKCIAIVMPRSDDGQEQRYEIPTDSEALQRYYEKLGTKFERQLAVLCEEGYDDSFLQKGIMTH